MGFSTICSIVSANIESFDHRARLMLEGHRPLTAIHCLPWERPQCSDTSRHFARWATSRTKTLQPQNQVRRPQKCSLKNLSKTPQAALKVEDHTSRTFRGERSSSKMAVGNWVEETAEEPREANGTRPAGRCLTGWANEHKMELVAVGIGIAAIVTARMAFKRTRLNWTARAALPRKQPASLLTGKSVSPPLAETAGMKTPHSVSGHVRNLPAGWNASAAKSIEAAANGFNLKPGQTWVTSYSTGVRAA